ncbi:MULTISPECIES: type VI secretion system protein TssL, long form [Yersinia]|jgi:type VI secretion system protein ImpK|nr:MULTISPECIES: type VI secretion system protein TssL, long form [Yersinia]ARB86374.1 type VI secretion system protein TssL [Yersinia sp. FDAARGOS_228]AVL36230.1 type VI secretion system protein TssL [Yersinia intermedia]MCB5300279.1 type VI secretion system protein TssL, long form [Yersinia intermedia]MDA5514613.1 type VI secretion system protein TssL, long form [Yersinia intermedia]MDN0117187.1 type VI secretion system protein TssL, long form [Yersinia intermedia]
MSNSSELNGGISMSPFDQSRDADTNPQALGHFLLDDQGTYTGSHDSTDNTEQSTDFNHKAAGSHSFQHYDTAQLRGESVQQRVAKAVASSTPLLEAAQPLLRALSEMPETIADVSQVQILKDGLKNELTLFSVVCDEADISWKKMAIIRYCLCTALDEAAHTMSWGVMSGWSQSNLLNHFEGDNDGGNKFFLLVGRLSMSPHEYADCLEILLRILGLGFEGRYSIIEDGDRQLTKIRQGLLTLLQSTRDTVPSAISPHGLVSQKFRKRRGIFIPVRVSMLLCGFLIASTFIASKYFLSVPESDLLKRMTALQRPIITQPPVAVQKLRLAVLLKDEIAKQLVSVDEKTSQSKVIFKGDTMFQVGSDKVRPEIISVIERVAQEVHRVEGAVLIVGHTDSMPINKPGFPNNQVLSEKRAANVAHFMEKAGIPTDKIRFEGKGDIQPVGSNDDATGRSQNRRVEIFVNY